MGTGYTGLDNPEYDKYLADKKDFRRLIERKKDKKAAAKRDGSGYHFGIDSVPVKTKNMDEFRKELDKRGLAIDGEYRGQKRGK